MSTHMITENPYEKQEAILQAEASHCFSCGHEHVYALKEPNGSMFRNQYICRKCGTRWYGNAYYENSYEAVDETKNSSLTVFLLIAFIISVIPAFIIAPVITFFIAGLGIRSGYKLLKEDKKIGKTILWFSIICLLLSIARCTFSLIF